MASTSFHLDYTMTEVEFDAVTDVLSYISRLDLDDIDSLQSRSQRKPQDADYLSDEELAMLLFVEEAEGLLNRAREHRSDDNSTESLSMLDELLQLEDDARYDHQVALAIAEDRPIPPRPERRVHSRARPIPLVVDEPAEEPDSESDTSSLLSSEDEDYLPGSSSSSVRDAQEDPEPSHLLFEATALERHLQPFDPPCTICGDEITGIVLEAPCGHLFDTTCMETMFSKASVDESLYPPRCCLKPIPSSTVRQHLSAKILADFDKKSVEFDTPAGSRVYCCRQKCSAFLGASTTISSTIRCTDNTCVTRTCGMCRKEAHGSSDCAERAEADARELDQMAADLHQSNGWTRCYSCHHLVEKSEGCYHIICTCKAQFCYLCGTPWKECDCPQFEIPLELQD